MSKAIDDPICGNCSRPLSVHYHETEEYCYPDTTGDVFTDEPRDDLILERFADRFPEEYSKLVQEWKIENGHVPKPPKGA